MKLKTTVIALAIAFSSPVWSQTASKDELKMSDHLSRVKAPQVWNTTTGRGVTVGVVDSGITVTNPDLAGKIVTAPNTNFTGGSTSDVRDLNGHGTHVSGIIAAAANGKGVVGVAPDAKIVPVKVALPNGRVNVGALAEGITRASQLAPIINISIGGVSCCAAQVKGAVDRGALLVIAAGNNGQSVPLWPARYAKEAWAKGQIIAVGAVDQNNVITSWSNKAGDTQNFYLVAPGTWIYSTKGDGHSYMSGTSMAAPVVAGAAALVKSRWTYLRADQVADILLRSATDLGAPGVDPIYGRGLLNIEQAMKPVGTTYVVNATGKAVTTSAVKIAPAPAYSSAVRNTSVKSVELDEFGRDFEVDLKQFVVVAPDQTLTKLLTQNFDQAKNSHQTAAVSFNLSGNKVSAGVLGSGVKFMQLNSNNKNVDLAANLMSNPAINFVSDHNHVGLAKDLGQGLQVKAATFTTVGADQLTNRAKSNSRANATAVSVAKHNENSSVGITVSTLNESDKFLGGGVSGFGISGAPNLTFVTAEAAVELGRDAAAFVQFTQARSAEGSNKSGFAATVDRAQAIKLGIVQNNVAKHNDTLTVTVEQPLRVSSGKLTANLPVGRDETGQLMFENKTIDLAAAGRETQIKFDYMVPVKKQTHARAFLQFNHNPAHDSAAKTQSIIGLQLFMTF